MHPRWHRTSWTRWTGAAAAALVVLCAGRAGAYQFDADASVYSRISGDTVPEQPEALAEELAAALGLETVPPAADGTPLFRHSRTGMLFVFIPGGTFTMGSNHSDIFAQPTIMASARRGRTTEQYFAAEQPAMEVYVSPFFIGRYETTVAEFRQFLEEVSTNGAAPYELPGTPPGYDHTPHLFDEPIPFWEDRQPAVGITWLTAYAFCRWMGGRLPTEAEWEKAARGSDLRLFPWGDSWDPLRANTAESGNSRTLPVGTYPGGSSPYGCLDMAGNAQEYTLDAFDATSYTSRKVKDPCLLVRSPPSDLRVARGGSWNLFSLLHQARTTARNRVPLMLAYPPFADPPQYLQFGVRVALSPDDDLFPEGSAHRVLEGHTAAPEDLAPGTPPEDEEEGPGSDSED